MKNLIVILILLIVPMFVVGQNLKALDEKYGFRGAKFEMPFSSFKGLIKLGEVSKEYIPYKATNEDLRLGDYTLDEVDYTFYKGKLAAIMINTKGSSNGSGLLKILQTAYGKGVYGNKYIDYVWQGEKVRMTYQTSSVTNDVNVIMMSVKLRDLMDADEKRANKEAAKGL